MVTVCIAFDYLAFANLVFLSRATLSCKYGHSWHQKKQHGDSQNAKIEASKRQSTHQWVMSRWLGPYLNSQCSEAALIASKPPCHTLLTGFGAHSNPPVWRPVVRFEG